MTLIIVSYSLIVTILNLSRQRSFYFRGRRWLSDTFTIYCIFFLKCSFEKEIVGNRIISHIMYINLLLVKNGGKLTNLLFFFCLFMVISSVIIAWIPTIKTVYMYYNKTHFIVYVSDSIELRVRIFIDYTVREVLSLPARTGWIIKLLSCWQYSHEQFKSI